jgi:hypothetical protein
MIGKTRLSCRFSGLNGEIPCIFPLNREIARRRQVRRGLPPPPALFEMPVAIGPKEAAGQSRPLLLVLLVPPRSGVRLTGVGIEQATKIADPT